MRSSQASGTKDKDNGKVSVLKRTPRSMLARTRVPGRDLQCPPMASISYRCRDLVGSGMLLLSLPGSDGSSWVLVDSAGH